VTRVDGGLTLGHLDFLCEHVKESMSLGLELMLATLGVMGIG
jgi:hypothetical protein